MKRTMCSACGHTGLDKFLDLGSTPIADAYTESPDDPVNWYLLELAVCNKCWLVQLLEVVDPKILFGTGYSFYTSASPPLSRYHEEYAEDILRVHRPERVLEIGCNDGDLLRHFDEVGIRCMGVDPAKGPVRKARERGLDIRWRPFNLAFARDILDMHGTYDLIIANHVLAHVADVADMLAGISVVLSEGGTAMIEVQYLPDLLVNNAFDLVYHEHRNFFSLTSLEQAALLFGLHLYDVKHTSRQGGSIRASFSKSKVGYVAHQVNRTRNEERWLQGSGPYEGFQGRVDRIKTRLYDMVTDEKVASRSVAGYGAPAKATTLLNYCNIDNSFLDFVIDTTPAKQGRYIPGTGIQIVAPAEVLFNQTDTFLLLAWNYLREIHRREEFFGNWIVPIPSPVLL